MATDDRAGGVGDSGEAGGRDGPLGFHSVDREYDTALPVSGTVPGWLEGTLLRNGPGRFTFPDGRVDHWFDGLAMLRRFDIHDGEVHYRTRFLDTAAYEAAGEGAYAGFGTAPDSGLLRRLYDRLAPPDPTDNTSVNVWRYGGEWVALTETTKLTRFAPDSLATRERTAYPDAVDGQTTTAHPHHDRERGETVNLATSFGRRSAYHVYRVPDGTWEVETVARVETDRPSYLHSFGLTESHVVVAEFPLVVHPLRLLAPTDESFIERFRWRPERGTRYHVLDRASGERVARIEGAPLFCFHHVNAFDAPGAAGEELVVDMVTFSDADAIGSLYLADIADVDEGTEGGALTRVRLDLGAGTATRTELHPGGIGLPRVAPAARRRPYRYVYGQDTQGQPVAELPAGVMKVDVETGRATRYVREGCAFHEPVFVPNPYAGDGTRRSTSGGSGRDPAHEDAGVVLTLLLDRAAERSVLLVLDARDMTELARAPLPHALPLDFHGQFVPA
jgi:beta,beta-carotene 9',10'-dioxygenase